MGFDPLFFAALALALGFKHAFDVDHVVAVSQLLRRQEKVEHALGLGITWAAGHMVTAAAVSSLVFLFAARVLPWTSRFELLVPAMLILIGVIGIAAEFRRLHVHRHEHGAGAHTHVHTHFRSPAHEHGAMAGIGFIHGLASNDELLAVLVVGLGADSVWQVLGGVALFSLGVVTGMAVYALGIHWASHSPALGRRAAWVPSALTFAVSVASIAYAAYLLMGGLGLNLLERLVRFG